jgi:hypothetical protein
VELHIPLGLLTELLDAPTHPEWTPLLTDVAAQHARGSDQHRDLDGRPDARLPDAALRRHTQIRDRTCSYPGCRYRAKAADQDHTRDHQRGGATIRANLGPLCPHDHRVKHLGGWHLEQPEPGSFSWRSPLGGVYLTHGEPFLPSMPEAAPTDRGERQQVRVRDSGEPILRRPVRVRPSRRRPPRGDPDDPPPF